MSTYGIWPGKAGYVTACECIGSLTARAQGGASSAAGSAGEGVQYICDVLVGWFSCQSLFPHIENREHLSAEGAGFELGRDHCACRVYVFRVSAV